MRDTSPGFLMNWNEATFSLYNSLKEKYHLQHELKGGKKKRCYISGYMHMFSKAANTRPCESLIGTDPLVNLRVVIMWQLPK